MLIKYANDNRYGMDGITTHDMWVFLSFERCGSCELWCTCIVIRKTSHLIFLSWYICRRQSAAVACSKLEEAREQANAFDVCYCWSLFVVCLVAAVDFVLFIIPNLLHTSWLFLSLALALALSFFLAFFFNYSPLLLFLGTPGVRNWWGTILPRCCWVLRRNGQRG